MSEEKPDPGQLEISIEKITIKVAPGAAITRLLEIFDELFSTDISTNKFKVTTRRGRFQDQP